ncbi:MAG: putative inorganic carbon transporter subunit DabA, partial [Gemmatimonadaceae bacterium]
DDTPLGIDAESALRHVQGRASHLAQPRPEYGHCTNAIAVVGRRRITRGLHLDRRPFLISYDPDIDQDEKILERILAAVGPVGAGINLEYYFSSVDNEKYGCGTKLPHNVTGLIGVMAGHQGDLRTGLPLQMVEIHEPMRLLLIVEATPEALLTVAGRQAEVAELVVNEWVQLVSVHPDSGAMYVFRAGAFHPYTPGTEPLPRVKYSPEWHTQGREHLPPAIVEAALHG